MRNNELAKMWKETVAVWFKVPLWRLPGDIQQGHDNRQPV